MGKDSGIEWTEHTFNPWWGCVKVSAGCTYCYAEAWAKRTGGDAIWGADAGRRFFKPKHFNAPVKWNRDAGEAGRFDRVMCGSMCDIFEIHENEETNARMDEMRAKVWDMISITENLIWILVTKRPENACRLVPPVWYHGWPGNVWLMVTMETQNQAEKRMTWVESTPAVVRAVSAEPLVGPLNPRVFRCGRCGGSGLTSSGQSLLPCLTCRGKGVAVDWIVAGGETGGKARPMDPEWIRDLLGFSLAYEIPFFFKQWGEWAPSGYKASEGYNHGGSRTFKHEGSDEIMVRLGKKKTGKALDGKEWTQTPPIRPRSDMV